MSEDGFTTFVADNADHNIATLDGLKTFHGMGMIAVTTNKQHKEIKQKVLSRPNKIVKVDELVKRKGIPIISYDFLNQANFDKLKFTNHADLIQPFIFAEATKTDHLWHSAGLFSTEETPRQNWNGFMQDISTGTSRTKSNIAMLPLINLKPSDETCLYSTLIFIINQSKALNVTTPTVTFDQPLWLKAFKIMNVKGLDIVPLLGGFVGGHVDVLLW